MKIWRKRGFSSFGLILFAVPVLLSGCSGAKATMQEIDGVLHVLNPSEPLKPNMDIQIEEILRIGEDEGPDEYILPGVSSLAADDEGRTFALIVQDETVRVFNADGTFSHNIGRRGEGPGELLGASGVNIGPMGNIWIPSMGLARLTIFKPDGEYLQDIRFSLLPPLFIQPTANGFMGLHMHVVPTENQTVFDLLFYLRRFNTEGDTLNTIFQTNIQMDATDLQLGGWNDQIPLYTQDDLGRIWQTRPRTDVFEVNVWNTDSTLDRVVEKEFEKLPKSAEDIEEERQLVEDAIRSRTGGGELPPGINMSYEPEPYRPATGFPYFDPRGYIWVQTSVLDSTDGNIFDLFDLEGQYLRRIIFPGVINPTFLNFVNDRIYLTDADPGATPQIIVFEVRIGN